MDPALAAEWAHYQAAAFPRQFVSPQETSSARAAAASVPQRLSTSDFQPGSLSAGAARSDALALSTSWKPLGPAGGRLAPYIEKVQNELPIASGRVTAMVISPSCHQQSCQMWIAAAGGGVWRTDHALAHHPVWTPIDDGLGSGTIGSLALDPNDPTHQTIYAGTGEDNLSYDSVAGTGLYKSVNGGDNWSLVPGSHRIANNASIGAVAIDPTNPSVIWMGLALGEVGSKDMADLSLDKNFGLYRSTDGGNTFTFQTRFGKPVGASDADVTGLAFDPTRPDTLYASTQGAGVWRVSPSLDGNRQWHRILASAGRTQVAVSSDTRVWITAGIGPNAKEQGWIFRIDNADQPFGQVKATKVSTNANGASGFCAHPDGYNQCSYDQALAVDPRHPDTAWVGGSNDYGQSATNGESDGRAVLRTLDGGRTWTDETDSTANPRNGLHPDIHAIALLPTNPNIAFVGSDGGVARSSGKFGSGAGETSAWGQPCHTDLCRQLLSSIPTKWFDLNAGLDTLQFQKVSVPNNASGDVQGGSQDNGTWEYNGRTGQWLETAGGDGAFTAIDATNPALRETSTFGPAPEVSHRSGRAHTWKDVTHNLAHETNNTFQLMPLIADPVKHARLFAGTNQIWRSNDWGKTAWSPLGFARTQFIISTMARAPSDHSTLWAGTGGGEVVFSSNIDAPASSVEFTNLTARPLPGRFISAVVVDPRNPTHAWISLSGFNSNTPKFPGHVFSATYNHLVGSARYVNISKGIGDQPVNDLAVDPSTGDLYAATDFGVLRLPHGSKSWERAAPGLPIVPVWGVTISPQRHELYAATNGRGVYTLKLPRASAR